MASYEVRQWAIDQGLSGAVTVNNNERALAAKVEKTARAEREKLFPASPTSEATKQETTLATAPGISSKIKAFQLPANYTALASDRNAQDNMIASASLTLIKKREGNGKDGKRYQPYADMVKQTDGSTANKGMVMGYGVKVSEFQDEALGGKTYRPELPEHRAAFDKYEEKRLLGLVPLARNQAAALGLPAEAIPVLASMNHQLGKGWMSDFKNSTQHIKNGNYDEAIKGFRDSKWNRVQTPDRVKDLTDMLEAVKDMKSSNPDWFESHKPKKEYCQLVSQRVISGIKFIVGYLLNLFLGDQYAPVYPSDLQALFGPEKVEQIAPDYSKDVRYQSNLSI